VSLPFAGGSKWNGARGQESHLTALDDLVDRKGNDRRHEQDHPYHGAHGEILLADNLLVGIRCQHFILSADNLRYAEVGDDQRENHENRVDDAKPRSWECNGPEDPCLRCAEGSGGLIEAPVGKGERCNEDQQCMRKSREHLPQDDADGSVNAVPHQQETEETLVAEDVNQGDRRKQRWREDRQQGKRIEQPLRGKTGARQRIGIGEGQRDNDCCRRDPNGQRILKRCKERRGREIGQVIAKSYESAVCVFETL
jgi:hypothetical protein